MKNDIFREDRVGEGEIGSKSFFSIEKGKSRTTFGTAAPFHYHEWYELYFILEGTISFTIDNRKYDVGPGGLVLIAPKCVHNIIYKSEDIKRALIYFTRDYVSSLLVEKMKLVYDNPVYVSEPEEYDCMVSIVNKLTSEYLKPDEFSFDLCKNLICELFLYFIRGYRVNLKHEKSDLVIDAAKRYINLSYANRIALEDISEHTGVSPAHLSRKFRQVMHMTVSDYIRMVRVEHAKTLLIKSDYTITQIAEQCGFSECTYFSYVFNKIVKTSPLKFRKMYSTQPEDKNT